MYFYKYEWMLLPVGLGDTSVHNKLNLQKMFRKFSILLKRASNS